MPKIQTYDRLQVQPGALPGVRQSSVVSPDMLGTNARQARATAAGLAELSGDLQQQQDRDDTTAIFAAETAIQTDYLKFQREARNRRGMSADGITREADEWWEKTTGEYSAPLSARQKTLLQQRIAKTRLTSVAGMSEWEDGQKRQGRQEVLTAANAAAIDHATSQVGTSIQGVAIETARQNIIRGITTHAQIEKLDPLVRDAEIIKATTHLHTQVLQNMTARPGNATAAKEYFEKYKGEINGEQHDALVKMFDGAVSIEKAQAVTDTLSKQGVTEAEGLAWIRENTTGEERKDAEDAWVQRIARDVQARERAQATAFDTATAIYAKTGRLADIPPHIRDAMDGKAWLALRKDAQEAAKLAMGKEPTLKTDWNVYGALREEARTNPEKFAQTDLRKYYAVLAPAQREQLEDMRDKLSKPEKRVEVLTDDKQVSIMVGKLGLKLKDKAQFEAAAFTALQDETNRNGGKPLTVEQRQKVIDRMALEGEIPGRLYNPNRRMYEVAGTPEAAAFMPDVPSVDRKNIIEAYQAKRKRVPTEQEIQTEYMKRFNL
jgi:hypothetical protein